MWAPIRLHEKYKNLDALHDNDNELIQDLDRDPEELKPECELKSELNFIFIYIFLDQQREYGFDQLPHNKDQ